jgi:hypothetical protein
MAKNWHTFFIIEFMQSVCEKIFNISAEILYDKYSSMVYAMALKISHDKKCAEEILISTFRKLYKQVSLKNYSDSLYITTIIRLVIQTAYEHINPTQPPTIKIKKTESINPNYSDLKIDKLFCNCAGFY